MVKHSTNEMVRKLDVKSFL